MNIDVFLFDFFEFFDSHSETINIDPVLILDQVLNMGWIDDRSFIHSFITLPALEDIKVWARMNDSRRTFFVEDEAAKNRRSKLGGRSIFFRLPFFHPQSILCLSNSSPKFGCLFVKIVMNSWSWDYFSLIASIISLSFWKSAGVAERPGPSSLSLGPWADP